MEFDIKNMKIGTEPFKNGSHDDKVFYGNKHIGSVYQVSGYPMSVKTKDGKHLGSFTSVADAAKTIYIASGLGGLAISMNGDIFTDKFYILRIADITVVCSPDYNKTIEVSARIYFNSHKSNGKSAASKPARSEMATIDLENSKITMRSTIEFANKKEMLDKLQDYVDENLVASAAKLV